MIAGSAPGTALSRQLGYSHQAVRQVYAFDPSGTALYGGEPLPIIGGQLTLTWTDAVRCQGSLILPALPELVPDTPADLLGCNLNRLDVIMGVPGSTVRTAQLYVNAATRTRPDNQLTLTVGDRLSRVAQRIFGTETVTTPTAYRPGGGNYIIRAIDSITGLLREALADATITVTDDTTSGLPTSVWTDYDALFYTSVELPYPEGSLYLNQITSLADRCQAWLIVDADGAFRLVDDPGAPGTSVLTLATGPGGTVVSVTDGLDRSNFAANRYSVKAIGEYGNPDEHATATITTGDYAPSVIGYVDGYAERTNYGSGWAAYFAEQLLGRKLPRMRRWTIDAVPYPGLEPGDTITLYDHDTGESVDLMLDTVTMPFDLGQTMTLTARNAAGTT